MTIGWLVNDCLTCIPGTKTFWHDLLEWIPNLMDKTNGYTKFGELSSRIEEESKQSFPDYIIRNAFKIQILKGEIGILQEQIKDMKRFLKSTRTD